MPLRALHHYSDEISKDAYHGTCDEYKHEHTGNPFFQIGIFPKEMPDKIFSFYQTI